MLVRVFQQQLVELGLRLLDAAHGVAADAHAAPLSAEDELHHNKRVKGHDEVQSGFQAMVVEELQRLGVGLPSTETTATDSTSSSTSSPSSSSSSSSSSVSTPQTDIGGVKLAPPLLEWLSFSYPAHLFGSSSMDLHEVELKNGWTLTPSKYGRPALEIATAKRGPNRSPVSIVLPVDCADPSHPAVFIKLSDGSDGQIKSEDDGIPLAAFLCTLEEHDPSADQKAKSTIGQEDEEEEEEEEEDDEDDDEYSGFISAMVTGEDLPSDEEDDEDHDADAEYLDEDEDEDRDGGDGGEE